MSIINKLFGTKKEPYSPAECEYYVLCERQYGTQQCSWNRENCLKCERRQSYIDEKTQNDFESKRAEKLYTEEGRNTLWSGE